MDYWISGGVEGDVLDDAIDESCDTASPRDDLIVVMIEVASSEKNLLEPQRLNCGDPRTRRVRDVDGIRISDIEATVPVASEIVDNPALAEPMSGTERLESFPFVVEEATVRADEDRAVPCLVEAGVVEVAKAIGLAVAA